MARKKTSEQAKLYEFFPTTETDINHIIELFSLIRVGVSGDLLEKASPELKKYFKEVKNDNNIKSPK